MKIVEVNNLDFLDQIVECQLKMAYESEGIKLDKDILTKGVSEVINNQSRGKYYITLDSDNLLIGMLLTISEWSDWRCREVLWIHSVYVIPNNRKQGVYSKMYNHIKSLVQQSEQYAGLRLYVDKTNKPAMAVYEKHGMNNQHYHLYEWLK